MAAPLRLAAIVVVLLAVACGGARADTTRLHVLFVGNSLTAANDLPAVVAAFSRAVGGPPIEVRSYAPGGFALEDHWADGAARTALDAGGWDAVVLQQGPSSLPDGRLNLVEWAKRWADEARAHAVRPALLTVWPERYRSAVFPAVIANYAAAAKAAHAATFPAGVAWRHALGAVPRPQLYGPDGFHPSRLGTYLTAAVVYVGLTGELPRRFPLAVGGIRVSPQVARVLRAAVDRAY